MHQTHHSMFSNLFAVVVCQINLVMGVTVAAWVINFLALYFGPVEEDVAIPPIETRCSWNAQRSDDTPASDED